MHISDWSSDVCSSDLAGEGRRERIAEGRAPRVGAGLTVAGAPHHDEPRIHRRELLPAEPDRKSVVQGQSVPVRVVLGGRSSIQRHTAYTYRTMRDRTHNPDIERTTLHHIHITD